MNEQHKQELIEKHGLTEADLEQAQQAGIPWALILQLLQKYGPLAWQVIQDIIAHRTPPAPVK